MSLINCPECSNQVSDTAKTCPHCGYELNHMTKPVFSNTVEKKTTYLSKTKTSNGILAIIWGIICLLGGFAFLFIFVPIGIIGFLLGIGIFVLGIRRLSSHSKSGECPYCNSTIEVYDRLSTFSCPYCKKISKVKDNSLETI